METYQNVKEILLNLERQNFPHAQTAFAAPCELITGGIQFAALDTYHCQRQERLPVVCAFGINYTQQSKVAPAFYSYRGRKGGAAILVDAKSTGSRNAIACLIAAYNRNTTAWLSKGSVNFDQSRREVGPFGTCSATAGISNDFILVMTNRSPFLTGRAWQIEAKKNRSACQSLLNAYPNQHYFSQFFSQLGCAIDLWIGHSAIDGTAWVFPYFRDLVRSYNVKKWLLTPNISSRTSLNIRKNFSVQRHRLHELFR
jgi:hypothetical protein